MQEYPDNETLATIVRSNPAAAGVFETIGLDYCCGGRRPLHLACEEAGVETVDVRRLLAKAPRSPDPDWMRMDPVALVNHIEATHHAFLRNELRRLPELARKVVAKHASAHPELVDVESLIEELRSDLLPHMDKEEVMLFPTIRGMVRDHAGMALDCMDLQGPVSMMMMEHERTGAILERLQEVTGGFAPPSNACMSYQVLYEGLALVEADTHLHIHKENNVLFPAVLMLEEEHPE